MKCKAQTDHVARTRNCVQIYQRRCEERSDAAIHSFFTSQDGLLRFARNDGDDFVARMSVATSGAGCLKIESENGEARATLDYRQ
jgi:hypothetical protein